VASAKTYAPASDSDWAPVSAAPLPDAAANELGRKDVRLPLNISPDSPNPTKVILSDPYTDPVTGKRFRDVGWVTPSVTVPGTSDFQTAREELDSAGNPATDPATGSAKPPEEQKDECLQHPDRVGCKDVGDIPAEADIKTLDKTISITPDTGWGADTAACPADLTTTFMKQPIAFSFKPVCDAADSFRPVVIALAWITAVLTALGISRRNS
jgi:hypothetical protein